MRSIDSLLLENGAAAFLSMSGAPVIVIQSDWVAYYRRATRAGADKAIDQ
ncbi:hypothetical protein [Bradyrhizobium sp. ISRA463]|nr:hypothetical protein [Bradyrhizobium sp. ISRA463]WGS24117.1 hypothetical protein MTX22_29475 [Bradyrhizobium sp. ISRA463]